MRRPARPSADPRRSGPVLVGLVLAVLVTVLGVAVVRARSTSDTSERAGPVVAGTVPPSSTTTVGSTSSSSSSSTSTSTTSSSTTTSTSVPPAITATTPTTARAAAPARVRSTAAAPDATLPPVAPATPAPLAPTPPPTPAPVAVAPPRPTYGVGAETVTFIDPTRPTEARGDRPATSDRTIVSTIWYPVGAPGPVPLVAFAEGYNTSAGTYQTLLTAIAAAGYVVVAPEFPMTSTFYGGSPDEGDLENQPGDLSFVISATIARAGQGGAIGGLVDGSRIAVAGHSDGGITATWSAFQSSFHDPRIAAAVILSGAMKGDGPWFPAGSPPLLAVHGTADTSNNFGFSQQLFDEAPVAKFLLTVIGGSHLGPFTSAPSSTVVTRAVLDFLDRYLHDDIAGSNDLFAIGNLPGFALAAA